MREIKFRAWDKKNKKMIYPTGLYGDIKRWHIESSNSYWGMYSHGRVCGNADDSGILLQYIGLEDKNGKEIYKGDIVEIINSSVDEEDGYFLVEFESERARYILASKDLAYDFDNTSPNEIEVIGNIYENKDLLEGEPQ
jgi:uncharacterized phage protein (TIGR01671 family)